MYSSCHSPPSLSNTHVSFSFFSACCNIYLLHALCVSIPITLAKHQPKMVQNVVYTKIWVLSTNWYRYDQDGGIYKQKRLITCVAFISNKNQIIATFRILLLFSQLNYINTLTEINYAAFPLLTWVFLSLSFECLESMVAEWQKIPDIFPSNQNWLASPKKQLSDGPLNLEKKHGLLIDIIYSDIIWRNIENK